MVRQGFTVNVIPSSTNPAVYNLWVTSQGWEDGRVVVTRQVNLGTMLGSRSEFFPHDFAEWVDGMMNGMREHVFAYLKTEGAGLVSAEAAYREAQAETSSSEA